MQPTVGRIVHYKLSEGDAEQINRRRLDAGAFRRSLAGHAIEAGEHGRTGHVEHVGNSASEGDVYPAVIVRTWAETGTTVNLQVLLDGNDHYWATSRQEGEQPGYWSWPPRVEHKPG